MKKGLWAALVLFCVFLNGCTGVIFAKKDQSVSAPQALEPQMMIKLNDIPVPSGFKFLQKHSYYFQTGEVRVAVLKYSGRPDAERAFTFYKEQMPIFNWNLLNTVEFGKRMLNFDRENETCIITIEPKTLNTLVTVSIGPKQKTSSQKAEKPLK
jgi:hypothetical protein